MASTEPAPCADERLAAFVALYERLKAEAAESEKRIETRKREEEATNANVHYSLARQFLEARAPDAPEPSGPYELHWDLGAHGGSLELVGVSFDHDHHVQAPVGPGQAVKVISVQHRERLLVGRRSLVSSSSRWQVGRRKVVPIEDELLDFAKAFSSHSFLARDARDTYRYRPGVMRRLDEREFVFERAHPLWLVRLLDCWLRLHSAEYLDHHYGLSRLPRVPRTPRLLTTRESFVSALVTPSTGTISLVRRDEVPDVVSESPGRESFGRDRIGYVASWDPKLSVEAQASLYYDACDRGHILVYDTTYAHLSEAIEARFRLREALGALTH
jgi:hypothetical protein